MASGQHWDMAGWAVQSVRVRESKIAHAHLHLAHSVGRYRVDSSTIHFENLSLSAFTES